MKKLQSHPHLVALALAVVAMLVSLATLAYRVPSPGQMLVRGIGEELNGASPATVSLHLARLEALQADALPVLVDALGSDRIDVSRGARTLIEAEFNRWQALPTGIGSRHVDHLARLLAAHAPGYRAEGREHARQLALRIAQWPIDREVVDRTQLIATCEFVLRTAGQGVPATLAGEPSGRRPREAGTAGLQTSEQWHARRHQDNASIRVSDDPELEPGLPADPPILPATQPELGVPRPPVADDRSHSRGAPQAGGGPRSAPASRQSHADWLPLATSQPVAERREPRVAFPLHSTPLRTAPVVIPTRDELKNAETIVVMRWLLVDEAATIARAALSARGFSEVQIRVARQIVDPDPAVRLELARTLPNIAGNDPRPWLLWLSRDVDPRVRLVTVGILATSPDPSLQNRLIELELEETDASVLRVVRRALEQRGPGY